MTTYFKAEYDTLAGGSFAELGVAFTEVTWVGGGRGQIIQDFPDGTIGKLHVALIAGALPTDGQTMTQGAVTAVPNGNATTLLYPAFFRRDIDITTSGADKSIDWDSAGGAPVAAVTSVAEELGVIPTHSFFFDGGTGVAFAAGDVLTFGGGQTAELINAIDGVQPSGELEIRITSNLDAGLPVDGDTVDSDGSSAAGAVQGEMHARSYLALHLHRLLADLNDDDQFVGDDDLSMLDATPSAKDTDQIVRLIGGAFITDDVADHMYGGSIAQNPAGVTSGGDTKFSGLDVQVTSPFAATRPVLIQYSNATGFDTILTDYYSTAWNPDSIAGNVRLMVKIRDNGVDIDGRRVKGKLLEYTQAYFSGGTTLGDATTSLALFSSADGNNTTDINTIKASTANVTEGFTTQTYGATTGDFAAILDPASISAADRLEAYEFTKWIQARTKTTAPAQDTLFGRDGRLIEGVNRNFAYSGAGALTENEIMAWGTEIVYTGLTAGPYVLGEVVEFVGSGARGRIYYDDNAANMVVGDVVGTPLDTDTITTVRGAAETTSTGITTVTLAARFGIGLVMAFDDDGATGNVYYQALAGLDPISGQTVFGRTSDQVVDLSADPESRTINNQWVGIFTGTNFQTNFGIGIISTKAILGDLNAQLVGSPIGVPNNQSGTITNLIAGDRVTCYPWDNSTTDENGDAVPTLAQATLTNALIADPETEVVVSAIPDNTPQIGWLRIEMNSGVRRLIAYGSWAGSTFQITGTENFSTDQAASTNEVMIGYLDTIATGASESFTSVYGPGDTIMTVTVRRGSDGPIVPFKTNPTFGSGGFSVAAGRIDDA